MYIYTGGEPLVRKKDLIKICEMHPDCEFLSFTNGTLIDEEFCQEMLRVKNFVPAISLEIHAENCLCLTELTDTVENFLSLFRIPILKIPEEK